MASDINQRLGFEAAGAIKTLRSLAKSLGTAATAMSAFTKSARNFNASTAGFDASIKNLSTQIAALSAAAAKLTPALRDISNETSKGAKPAVTWASALKNMALSAARVFVIQSATRLVRQFIAAVSQGIDASRQFGLRLAEIETISHHLTSSTQTLSNKVQALAIEFGRSANDVAEGLYQTISNQVEGASDAFGLLSESMKLATVTAAKPRDAINAVASVLNSYSLDASHAAEVSDVLFKTVELGRLRLSEIADIIGRVTPLSSKLGISFKETAAAIAVMTRQGVRANTAVTQLRAVEQKLIKPTEKMAELFKKWGVEDGATAIKTFGGLTGVLKKLSKETAGNDAEMASYFSRVRAIVGEMALMTKEGKLMTDTLLAMDDSIGAVNRAWEKFKGTEAQQMTSAIEALNVATINAGKALLGWAITWTHIKISALNTLAAILGNIDSVTRRALELNSELDKSLRERQAKQRERNPLPTEAELNKELEGYRKALAEFQAEHNKVMKELENSVAAFSAGAGKRLKGIFRNLAKDWAPVKTFLADFKKNTSDLKSDIASLKDELAITEAQRGKGTKREERTRTKIAEREITKATGLLETRIDADSVKAAQTSFDLAKQQLETVKKLNAARGDTYGVKRADRALKKLLKDRIAAEETVLKKQQAAYPKLKAMDQSFTDQVAEKNKLADQWVNLSKQFELAIDPAEKEQIRKDLATIEEQIKSFSFEGMDKTLLKALNVDYSAQAFSNAIETAVNNIHIDWERIMSGAEARLNKIADDAARSVGATKQLSEARKAGTYNPAKGIASVASPDNVVNAKIESDKAKRAYKEALQEQTKFIQQYQNNENALVGKGYDFGANVLVDFERGFKTLIGLLNPYTKRVGEATEADTKANDAVINYSGSLRTLFDALLSGKSLTDQQNSSLQQLENTLKNDTSVTESARLNITEMINTIYQFNIAVQKANKTKLELSADGLKNAESNLKNAAASSKELESRQRDTGKSTKEVEAATASLVPKVNTVKNSQQDVTTAVNNTLSAQVNDNQAVSAMIGLLSQATVEATKLARARQAAAAANATAYYGGVQHLASGGLGQDTVHAMLTPGEFVVNKASTNKFFSDLSAINSGSKPVRREQGGSITNVGDVNVTIQGGDSPSATVREIGQSLRREIRRGTLSS